MAKKKVSDAEMRRNRDFMAAQTERMEQQERNRRLSIESVDRVFGAWQSKAETAHRVIVKHESSDGENNNGGDNEIEAEGNAPVSQPTMWNFKSLKECIISDDTFRRIRVAAKVRKKLNGVKPRERRYSQSEVGHLIGALRSGKFNNANILIEGWSKWATPQISK